LSPLLYYNPKSNSISHFKPDFAFWLQKGDNYFIIFIDPKGIEHTDYERKIDGYRRVFEEDRSGRKIIYHDRLKVRVFAFLYTDDESKVAEGYREYWIDKFGKALTGVLDNCTPGGIV